MTNKGEELDLASLAGSAWVAMNVASECPGTTKSGYETATELYNKYRDRRFTVLAFPCNQFGWEEPGTNEEIQTFATERFNANFPIMDKVNVNGDKANAFWEFLKNKQKGLLGTTSIKWNFTSFLIDRQGNVVNRYSPRTSAEEIEKDLVPLLA